MIEAGVVMKGYWAPWIPCDRFGKLSLIVSRFRAWGSGSQRLLILLFQILVGHYGIGYFN